MPARRRPSVARQSSEVAHLRRRPVVVTALALRPAARRHLASQLGDVEIRDLRDDLAQVDLIIAPACSPQAISALKQAFPAARLVVVELDDPVFNVRFRGPITRVLDAGANAYLLADSIDHLADQLRRLSTACAVPAAVEAPKQLGAVSVDDVIIARVGELVRRRAEG